MLAIILACALQVMQVIFTPHLGYTAQIYNPTNHTLVLKAVRQENIAAPGSKRAAPAFLVDLNPVAKIPAHWAAEITYNPGATWDGHFHGAYAVCAP